MTKDYKHQVVNKRKSKPAPSWVWMLSGLGMGLMVAGLVYLRLGAPVEDKPQPEAEVLQQQTVQEQQQKKTDGTVSRPRFEFYTILPEMEVVVPDYEITGPSHRGVRQVEEQGNYILQAGSFRSAEQADGLRARLTLLGLEASIETVTVGQNEIWHRVRAGPYDDLEKLNEARVRLRDNQIDAILVKEKDE